MSKRSSKRSSVAESASAAAPKQTEITWAERLTAHAHWIAIALVVIGTLRIAATYDTFGHTVDEGFHIACGLEWITRGTYKIEAQQPPLARLFAAAGPWLTGAKLLDGDRSMFDQALGVLYGGDDYDRRVLWARLGMLPAFWFCAWAVWTWCARWFDRIVAVAAVALVTMLPVVLAHAGLANTDVTFTACFTALLVATLRLAEEPSLLRGAIAGVALTASLLAKFSTLPFLPVCLIAALAFAFPGSATVFDRARRLLAPAGVAVAVCFVLVWAGYRFSYGKPPSLGFAVPAPEFFNGIEEVRKHNAEGHDAYVLGQYSETTGFWYYYPIALLFKTPIAFLVLAGIGVQVAWKRGGAYRIPIACTAGVLAFTAFSRINIGVRHVLPVYIFLAILAAIAVRWLWLESRATQAPALLAAMLLWLAGTSLAAHPDYLAYFNFLAGSEPESVLVDSDLDWGQDMKRLGVRLEQLGVQQVAFNPALYGFWEEYHGFPRITPLDPRAPKPGWNAVSLTLLKYTRMATRKKDPNMRIWTDTMKPTERVGSGILLYYNPAGAR